MPDPVGFGAMPPSAVQGSTDSTLSALSGMDSEGFLQLLVAQLQYQNPMEPSDPGDMMGQTSQLAMVDASQQLLAAQQQALIMDQAVAAAGMLGTEVSATDRDGEPVAGRIDAVRYTAQGPMFDIGGSEVALYAISELRAPGASTETLSTTSEAASSAAVTADPSMTDAVTSGAVTTP